MIEFHLVGTRNWVALGQKIQGDGGTLMVCIFFAILFTQPNLYTEFNGVSYCRYAEPRVVLEAILANNYIQLFKTL